MRGIRGGLAKRRRKDSHSHQEALAPLVQVGKSGVESSDLVLGDWTGEFAATELGPGPGATV